MAEQLNPLATHHLPGFVTPPGETDVLMGATAIFLAVAVVGIGVFYFRLHALPEHLAHKSQKIQLDLVAILCLIALFTHTHIYWIAALLLAFIDLPDFGGFLGRIAGSVERIAGLKPGKGADDVPETGSASPSRVADAPPDSHGSSEPSAANKPLRAVAGRKEVDHV